MSLVCRIAATDCIKLLSALNFNSCEKERHFFPGQFGFLYCKLQRHGWACLLLNFYQCYELELSV